MRNAGTGPNANDLRVVYDFEPPPPSEFAWLNTGTSWAAVIDAAAKTHAVFHLRCLGVAADAARPQWHRKSPPVSAAAVDLPHEMPASSACKKILNEIVTLGRSQPGQAGKRGNRKVIPITGGTLTGLCQRKILFGGAD